MSEKKTATIFDHISGVTDKKTPWSKLSVLDRKSFSVYLVNRWLSMNMDFIETVNELQKYTIGQISSAETYKLYFDILPKQKQFNKYIKGKKAGKYNSDLVELLSKHHLISEREAIEYLDLYFETSIDTLKEIIKKYGKTSKEIDRLLKNEK